MEAGHHHLLTLKGRRRVNLHRERALDRCRTGSRHSYRGRRRCSLRAGIHFRPDHLAGAGLHGGDLYLLPAADLHDAAIHIAEGCRITGEHLADLLVHMGEHRSLGRMGQAQVAALNGHRPDGAVGHSQVNGIADVSGTQLEHQQVQTVMEGNRHLVAHIGYTLDTAERRIRYQPAVEEQTAAGVFIAHHSPLGSLAADIHRRIEDTVALLRQEQCFVTRGVAIIGIKAQAAPLVDTLLPDMLSTAQIIVADLAAQVRHHAVLTAVVGQVIRLQNQVALVKVLRLEGTAGLHDEGSQNHPVVIAVQFRLAGCGSLLQVSKINNADLAANFFLVHRLNFLSKNMFYCCSQQKAFGFSGSITTR